MAYGPESPYEEIAGLAKSIGYRPQVSAVDPSMLTALEEAAKLSKGAPPLDLYDYLGQLVGGQAGQALGTAATSEISAPSLTRKEQTQKELGGTAGQIAGGVGGRLAGGALAGAIGGPVGAGVGALTAALLGLLGKGVGRAAGSKKGTWQEAMFG